MKIGNTVFALVADDAPLAASLEKAKKRASENVANRTRRRSLPFPRGLAAGVHSAPRIVVISVGLLIAMAVKIATLHDNAQTEDEF